MLKFNKFLSKLEKFLLLILIFTTSSMFFIKYEMYSITKNLSHIDKKIDKLEENKSLLSIELTYLTSSERILSMIEKNPKTLNSKKLSKKKQVKTKKELVNLVASRKSNNFINIARNEKNLTELIDEL